MEMVRQHAYESEEFQMLFGLGLCQGLWVVQDDSTDLAISGAAIAVLGALLYALVARPGWRRTAELSANIVFGNGLGVIAGKCAQIAGRSIYNRLI